MVEKDALDKLIVDEEENPDIDLLAEMITKYLKFTKSGEIILNKEFYKLSDLQKFILFLLGRKGILIKKLKKDFNEKVPAGEISKVLGIKETTIRKYVSSDLRDIVSSDNGKYFIPNYNLYRCKEKLEKNGKSK
jgi:uncharacterized protein with HEPN domain